MPQLRGGILSVEKSLVTGWLSPASGGKSRRGVAILLDDTLAGTAPVTKNGTGRSLFRFKLPSHLIASRLDAICLENGRSILPEPFPLLAHYRLKMLRLELDTTAIVGAFEIAAGLDEALLVELLGDAGVLARAVAKRRRSTAPHEYEFTAFLPQLLASGASMTVGVRIAGATPRDDTRIFIDPQRIGLLGYVDAVGDSQISGWIVNLRSPTEPVRVSLVSEGRTLATVLADTFRADVKESGFGNGRSAFSFPWEQREGKLGVEPRRLGVVLEGTETHLVNSPFPEPMSPAVAGYFDGIEGPFVCGWACHLAAPNEPLVLEAVCEGAVIGSGRATLSRQDVREAGIPTAKCGFRFKLDLPVKAIFDKDVYIRVRDTDLYIPGSPAMIRRNKNVDRYLRRSQEMEPRVLDRLRRFMDYQTRNHKISIVMLVYNPPRLWLVETLQSVVSQWSSNWELVCIDDCSTDPEIRRILQVFAKLDSRVRVLRTPQNSGIAMASNFGIRAATHDYVTFLDHDDFLEPDAVYRLASAAKQTGADFLYSDEAITEEDINEIVEVRARPAFSYDYYLSHPYFVHMICVKTELARRIGGWDESMTISADVDFVLRVIEQSTTVAHVPSVLYRWRTHTKSTGHSKQAEVMATTRAALTQHLKRQNLPARVADGLQFNQFRLEWPDDGGEVLIVIPTKDRVDLLKTCIDSVERTCKGANYRILVIDHHSSDPRTRRYLERIARRHIVMPYKGAFNYARMNNAAVRKHGGRSSYLLFLNNDIEAIEAGWLARLRSLAHRREVGVVGCLLLYDDDRVQHGGVLIGFHNAAEHAMKFADAYLEDGERNPGYNCSLNVVRDFSAVTAACMMMRREVFEQVGGFDEAFAVGFNDTDLCLRVRDAGLKVLYDGFTKLYHHESATRGESRQLRHPEDDERLRRRWRRYFTAGDPFYNPNLDLEVHDHALCPDDSCDRPRPPRVTLTRSATASVRTRARQA